MRSSSSSASFSAGVGPVFVFFSFVGSSLACAAFFFGMLSGGAVCVRLQCWLLGRAIRPNELPVFDARSFRATYSFQDI